MSSGNAISWQNERGAQRKLVCVCMCVRVYLCAESRLFLLLVVERLWRRRRAWGWVIAYLLDWKGEMGRKKLFLTSNLFSNLPCVEPYCAGLWRFSLRTVSYHSVIRLQRLYSVITNGFFFFTLYFDLSYRFINKPISLIFLQLNIERYNQRCKRL